MLSANDIQHGGDHYKVVMIQPWDVVKDWNLGYLDGTALKYISRWRRKNGVEDLKKAIHFLEKLIEQETTSPTLPKKFDFEFREIPFNRDIK